MKYRSTIPCAKPSGLLQATLTCSALVLLAACGMPLPLNAAEPVIDNLKNTKTAGADAVMTMEDIQSATPAPDMEFSPEEIEEMRRTFRALNPGLLDLEGQMQKDGALQKGVPEKVDDPSANAPFWSTGRLTFRTQAGAKQYCTAQFTADLKVILTAAHCVRDPATNTWNKDFVFLRADNNGTVAQTVGWQCLSIFQEFYTPKINAAYDYAFILADQNDAKPQLALGLGTPVKKDLTAVGYPQNYGGGKFLYKVDGDWAAVSGGIVTMKGNPMRHGNSGGAWFSNFKLDGGSGDNIVVSLNSHHVKGSTEDENGPLFTADTQRLMEHVLQGKCQ